MNTTQVRTGADRVVRTSQPDVAQDLLDRRFARHELRVLDRRKTLDFSLRQEELHNVAFHLVRYGRAVEVDTSGWLNFYLVQLTLSGACQLVEGGTTSVEQTPGSVCVVNPGTSYRKRWSSEASQLIVRLPRRWVERIASADEAGGPVLFSTRGDAGAEVAPFLRFLWADLTSERPTQGVPVIAHSAVRHLITVILHSVPNSAADPTDGSSPACLIRADGYMRDHLADDLTTDEVARACGISSRALQDAFRRHWRTTPTEHLRGLRLETAHRMLTERPFEVSVTDVANAIGIPHMSRFSRYYRSQFGELPSTALRRSRSASGSGSTSSGTS